MHFLRADLDFNGAALRANNRGVERLVKVEFWHRYVVFKASWKRRPSCVNRAKCCIAVLHAGNDHTNTDQVVDVVELPSPKYHLLVNRVVLLWTTIYLGFDLVVPELV